MIVYTTKDGDVVDDICFKYYGNFLDAVELVYESNKHLAYFPPILPSGIDIVLPEYSAPVYTGNVLTIWD